MNEKPRILVIGSSGYVGYRLIRELQEKGYCVRVYMRELRPFPEVEGLEGELTDKEGLRNAMRGVKAAYFLVGEEEGREGASVFGSTASDYGLKKVITLNCLTHQKSETSQIIRNSAVGVQVVEFRCTLILGGGSLLFEAIEKIGNLSLPRLTPPSFLTAFQPIAIQDVLKFLIKALEIDLTGHQTFEIAGSDKTTLNELVHYFQNIKEIKRYEMKSYFELNLFKIYFALFTPLYKNGSEKILRGLNITQHDPLANRLFGIHPLSSKEALREAIDEKIPVSRWVESLSASGVEKGKTSSSESKIYDNASVQLSLSPEEAFYPIKKFGNHAPSLIWKIKGWQDLLLGGVGVWRGRRDPNEIHVGEVIDFWRVEAYEPNRKLRLRAEMKVPGKVWLEYHVEGRLNESVLHQNLTFEPIAFWGRLYWYMIYPVHRLIFNSLLNAIVKEAKEHAAQKDKT